MRYWIVFLCILICFGANAKGYKPKAGEKVVKLNIKDKGSICIKLLPEAAPKTCAHIEKLVRDRFYNGIKFHRIVPDFVAQGGDPNTKTKNMNDPSIGTGGSGECVPLEGKELAHKRGTVGLARSQDPNSGDSQFFVNLKDNDFLNGNYCVFGEVVEGMDVVDKLVVGDEIELAVMLKAPKEDKEN